MLLSSRYKKILITGGAGFVGSHLAETLVAQGKNVVVFDNLSKGSLEFLKKCTGKNFHFYKGDLHNDDLLDKVMAFRPDMAVHLAANPDISLGVKDPGLDYRQTIEATFRVLEKVRKYNVSNFMFFSGSGVYGDAGRKISESFGPLKPVSMYGGAKLAAEGMISAYASLFKIKSFIFRPANIVGSRMTHGVIFDFIRKLRKNCSVLEILGDGKQNKSYIHIDDVLSAIKVGVEKGKENLNVFNVASNDSLIVNEIAFLVLKKMKIKNTHLLHTAGKTGWSGDVSFMRLNTGLLKGYGWFPKYSSRQAVSLAIDTELNSYCEYDIMRKNERTDFY